MIFLNANEQRIAAPIVLDYEKTDEVNKPSKLKGETTKGLTKGDRIIFGKEYIIVGVEEIRGRELSVEVYAEESIIELDGKLILDSRPTSLLMALQAITTGTRWTIGQFPTVAGKQLFFYGLSAYKALMEVLKTYNLELDTEYVYLGRTITRKINLRTRIGEQRGRRTTIQTDAVEIGRIYQDDPVVTRLYGYGKGEELDSGGYGRRVDIKTVNGGLEYIEDESARLQFGIGKEKLHYEARLVYPDITDPQELKTAMQADFEALKVPKITYTGKIEDFGLYDDKLGDDITVLDEELGIAVKGRILKLVTTPRGKEVALGNLMPTLHSEHQRLVDVDKRTQDFDVLRNAIIGIDGKDYLDGVIDRLNSELSATSGFVQVIPGRGLVIPNAPTEAEATQVIEIGGGFFRVADSKDQNGNWIYRTFGTGKGFTANEIVAGILKGGQVLFNLEAGTFIIGNPANPSLFWDGSNLKIDGDSIELTGTDAISLRVTSEVTEQLSDPAIQEQFKGDPGIQGPKGADGQPTYTWLKYADTPTSGMSDSPTGKKYIGLAVNKLTATESTAYADYTWSLIEGPQGSQGPTGADGQTTYTWVKYADTDTGTGMSDSPTGKRFVGMAFNKLTPTKSTVATDYQWSPLFDNVKVGGRNLIINSDDASLLQYMSNDGLTVPIVTEDLGTHRRIRRNPDFVTYPSTLFSNYATLILPTIIGEVYTDSIEVKPEKDVSLGNYIPSQVLCPSGKWTRISHTFTANQSTQRFMALYSTTPFSASFNPWIEYRLPKREKGNVATDWTPAPEDIEVELGGVKQIVTQNTADISTNANSITQMVTKTVYEKDVDDIEKKIVEESSKVSQTISDWGVEFKTAVVDPIENKVDDTEVKLTETTSWFRVIKDDNDIPIRAEIGESGEGLTAYFTPEKVSFMQDGRELAYFGNSEFEIEDGRIRTSLTIGDRESTSQFKFIPRGNGNLSLV